MKLLITAPRPERYAPDLETAFPALQIVVRDPRKCQADIAEADIVLGPIDRASFLAARRLRWIQYQGAGVEWLAAIPEIAESTVVVTNTRGAHAGTMAEHTLGLLIVLSRGFQALFSAQQQRIWQRPLQRPAVGLAGRTLGIIGLGHVGRAVAVRARAFEMAVIAVDAVAAPRQDYVDDLWGLDGLPELLRRADAVVVAAPLTSETRGMLGRAQLAQMKPSAYLLAISRGGIVDEAALSAALRAGELAGAALDVQAEEPVPYESALWDTPNLVLTPHCSGESTQTTAQELAIIRDNLTRFMAGSTLINVVDTRRGY